MQPAPDDIVLVRVGEISQLAVWRLHHAGFRVVVAELPQPLTIRRTVAVSSAVISGHIDIEGLAARRCDDESSVRSCWNLGEVPVVVAPTLGDVPLSAGEEHHRLPARKTASRFLCQRCEHRDSARPMGCGRHALRCGGRDDASPLERRVLFSGMAEPNTGAREKSKEDQPRE